MFSLKKSARLNAASEHTIIRKLTISRISGYKSSLIKQEFSAPEYSKLPLFITELANKILKANLISSKGISIYNEASSCFKEIVDDLAKSKHLIQVHCAAQLLQYYTIICDPKFAPHSSYRSWQQFLADNVAKFGETNNNVLIIEYTFILLYNELCAMADTYSEAEETSKDTSTDLAALILSEHYFAAVNQQIAQWIINAPDNIFIHYLMFIQHYAFAKLLELRYLVEEKNLTDDAKLQLSSMQNEHFILAKQSLDAIGNIKQMCSERGIKYAQGTEYTLGQNLFSKFPETNIDNLREQLSSLISS